MTNSITKLLFDECLTLPTLKKMAETLSLDSEIATIEHVIDRFGPGAIDDDWIPEAAREGCVIVTADRGKRPSKGGKLPYLCEINQITHVLVSASLARRSAFIKARAILDNWEDLGKLGSAPRGSKYSLRFSGSKSTHTRLVLLSEPTPAPNPGSGKLFDT